MSVLGKSVAAAVLVALLSASTSAAPAQDSAGSAASKPLTSDFQNGRYLAVIERALADISRFRANGDVHSQLDSLLVLSAAYEAIGMYRKAEEALDQTGELIEQIDDAARAAAYYGRFGAVLVALGQLQKADQILQQAVSTARQTVREDLLAALLNDLGAARVANGNPHPAIEAFAESASLARGTANLQLVVTAGINHSRALLDIEDLQSIEQRLRSNLADVEQLPANHVKASSLLALGELHQRTGDDDTAEQLYRQGLELARQLDQSQLASYALGYLGKLQELRGRYDDALRFTRRAIFVAQESGANESLYLWEWQSARILKAMGDVFEAIRSYERAVRLLEDIRLDLTAGTASTYQDLVDLVLEYADLTLSANASLPPAERQRNLRSVRARIETAKRAEIENYFDNQCVIVPQDREDLDRLAQEGAIVYPILLEDRLEIVVSLPDELLQFTSQVPASSITREVRALREAIEAVTNRPYLPHAQQLYDWLVRPMETVLERESVDTLVFVPDGPLRTIPLAALHDGETFLVERYAVANTTGLDLTNPKPLDRRSLRVLANGITQRVELPAYPQFRFEPLPHVENELQSVRSRFDAEVLQDSSFEKQVAMQEMSQETFSVVHIATHGHFDRDYRESFLLAADDLIKLDELGEAVGMRRFTPEAVELLVLSACETAAGDDQAALGLAGVALKAGARSAVATLWKINDESTSILMDQFYTQLQNPDVSKARALQIAQVSLIRGDIASQTSGARQIVTTPAQERELTEPAAVPKDHPYYWAAFLLIGNWL